MAPDAPHGLVLTGGGSRRMGRDKAAIEVGGVTLAKRTAQLLAEATSLAVEVGPGRTGLPHVVENPAGAGPLAAIVAGWGELVQRSGDKRPVVVLACDLPELTLPLVRWLADHPCRATLVPVVAGSPQPLAARWSVADLERAVAALAAGERRVGSALGPDAVYAGEEEWGTLAPASALSDVDTPEALAQRALAPPAAGEDDWIGLGRSPLPTELAASWATLPRCGAVVTFAGTVRDHAEGREGVEELAYEAYEEPALERMGEVVAEARRRWPEIARVAVLHRLGPLTLGETAVTVVVSSGHRQAAFAAGAYVIDTVKATVPIWKHERWAGGEDWGTGALPIGAVQPER